MKISKLKEIIKNIPSEFDDYNVVFSEIEMIEDETLLKTDIDVAGIISDDENKQMCIMDEKSYKLSLDI